MSCNHMQFQPDLPLLMRERPRVSGHHTYYWKKNATTTFMSNRKLLVDRMSNHLLYIPVTAGQHLASADNLSWGKYSQSCETSWTKISLIWVLEDHFLVWETMPSWDACHKVLGKKHTTTVTILVVQYNGINQQSWSDSYPSPGF